MTGRALLPAAALVALAAVALLTVQPVIGLYSHAYRIEGAASVAVNTRVSVPPVGRTDGVPTATPRPAAVATTTTRTPVKPAPAWTPATLTPALERKSGPVPTPAPLVPKLTVPSPRPNLKQDAAAGVDPDRGTRSLRLDGGRRLTQPRTSREQGLFEQGCRIKTGSEVSLRGRTLVGLSGRPSPSTSLSSCSAPP